MPAIKMAKPMRMIPRFRFFSFLDSIRRTMPMNARIGAKVVGLSSVSAMLSPLMPPSVRNQDVRVVPTLEPMIIPKVSANDRIPELTRPTSITVIADEDWMAMVIPAPRKKLRTSLRVTFFRVRSSAPPAICSSPPDMAFMPYRKKARPPSSSAVIIKISVADIQSLRM